ncbi:MAG: helix-turn-helix domain-containing protein [Candidatus Thorarchaeota archaeon]|jgi:excisionase family DNA binding protein
MDAPEYINLRALSKRLSVSPRTLRGWVSDHNLRLPAYKVKGRLRFNWAEVLQWLEQFRVETVDIEAIAEQITVDFNKSKEDEAK